MLYSTTGGEKYLGLSSHRDKDTRRESMAQLWGAGQVELALSVGDGSCQKEECILGCCIACVECECDRDDVHRGIMISDNSPRVRDTWRFDSFHR